MTLFESCPFIHDDIGVLYEVTPMSPEDLPKVCTCGATLTYSPHLIFINQVSSEPTDWNDLGETVMTKEVLKP